jgi:signal transduction histidine kinase/DNA-binding response OmpR family regulator
MKKTALLVCIFYVATHSLFSQSARSDSLWLQYKAEKNDSMRWAVMLRLVVSYSRHNPDSALLLCNQALKLVELQGGGPTMLFHTYNEMGNSYFDLSQYDAALENYQKAVNIGNKNLPVSTANPLSNIALIFSEKGDYSKARKYTLEAMQQYSMAHNEEGVVRQLLNLGTYELHKDHLDSAKMYFNQVITRSVGRFPAYQAQALNNLGVLLLDQKNYIQAEGFLQASLAINDSLGDFFNNTDCLFNLGKVTLGLGNLPKAQQLFEASLLSAKKTSNLEGQASALRRLAECYALQKDFEAAYKTQKSYDALRDSLNQSLYGNRIAELETQYQVKEQESQLAKTEVELSQQKQARNFAIAGALALALLGTGGWLTYRQRVGLRRREMDIALQMEKAEAKKLREIDTLKSAFFANLSHEFRTPLTLLISPLRELSRGQLRGDPHAYYNMMLRQGERLLELINQLLDLTKLDAGAMPLFIAKHDLADFLRQCLNGFRALAASRQIKLEASIPESPIFTDFDRDKMEKVINNLLSNALKFTPEEGSVRLSLNVRNNLLEIEVKDTGIGIPSEVQGRVFERFFRANESEQNTGTGIGLALTKELVDIMGGQISFQSQEHSGSVFRVILPTTTPSNTPVLASQNEILIPTPLTEKTQKPLLLLVEDHQEMREHLRSQLSESYRITEAINGKSGLEIAQQEIPDLIISDVMMPIMDGNEFCSRIKSLEATSHIPVILLTAKAERHDKLEGLLTGADEYLAKPFDAEELQVRAANLIRQRRLLQEKYGQAVYQIVATAPESESVDERFLQRVREEIESHIPDETYSVEDLSQSLGLSRSQLYRKLTALTGQGPLDIIRNLRLERAMKLLEQRAGNASEVSYMVGFSSPAYFIKCFRERYGLTPMKVGS